MYLNNCSLTDQLLTILLDGCTRSKNLNQLRLKRAQVLGESIGQIFKLIQIRPHNHLRELRLINCDTTPLHMRQLLQALAGMEICFLRSLALI